MTQPAVRTRKTRKEATRRTLKAAALKCFGQGGMEDASITAITREAGVAQGTFYVHFASKDALLDELLVDFNQGLLERLAALWTARLPGGDLRQPVERTAEIFLDYWSERRAFVRAYAARVAHGLGADALRNGVNPAIAALLAARLGELSRVSGAALPDPELVTQGLLSLWLRVGLQTLFNPDVKRVDALHALVDMTLGALQGVLDGATARATRRGTP